MNFRVLSKPSDISSTDGLVVLLISLRKWLPKSSQTRQVLSLFYLSPQTLRTENVYLFFIFFLKQKVTLWKKLYVLYSFFFVRKVVAHIVTFTFYCVVLPLTVLVPEVEVPKWAVVYIPTTITILNAVGTPRYLSSTIMNSQNPYINNPSCMFFPGSARKLFYFAIIMFSDHCT